MKRLFALILAAALALSLCSCMVYDLGQNTDYTPKPNPGGDLHLVTGDDDKTPTASQPDQEPEKKDETPAIAEDGSYTTKADVALYLHTYGKLPSNFITKAEAEKLGWTGGSLEKYAPGKCIGGSYFGNYEGLLPKKQGRSYYECDIDTLGAKARGTKRLVYSNDGLIYYTDDHYESFELLYGEGD